MRKSILRIVALLGSAILLSTAGCIGPEPDWLIGQSVRFTASTTYLNGPHTRTAYSGEDENGLLISTTSEYERIDWVAGDQIRIYSPQSVHANNGTQHFAGYTVTGVSGNGKERSNAAITPTGGNGLVWQATGAHDFYCVYPDPSTEGVGDKVTIGENTTTHDIEITGQIPETQSFKEWKFNEATGILEAKPDMNYAYMFAHSAVTAPQKDIKLYFKPLMTAFQFTLTSVDDEELTLVSLKLSSTTSNLAGKFTAIVTDVTKGGTTAEQNNYSTDAATFSVNPEGAKKYVEINLGNQKIYKKTEGVDPTAARPTTATITLFAVPQDLTDLTLELLTSASATPRKLKLEQNGSAVVFDACQKAYINNLGIPGTWSYHVVITKEGDIEMALEDMVITGEDVLKDSTKTYTIKAYKTATGMMPQPVEWKTYFVSGSSAPLNGSLADPAWSETPLPATVGTETTDWLTVDVTEGTGEPTPVDYSVDKKVLPKGTVSGRPRALEMIAPGSATPNLANTYYAASNPLDLSTYNFITKDRNEPATTANCYVIDGYGYFLIPLVYGNAIEDGASNSSAYTRANTSPLALKYMPVLNTHVNVDNNEITSPYILQDNLTLSGEYEGVVVWQDVLEGFEILLDEDIEVKTTKPAGAALNCAYIQFEIKQENIKPGNILLALRDKTTKKILWSWHLWVTCDALGTIDVENHLKVKNTFLTANIGYVPPVRFSSRTTTPLRQQYAVFVNPATNMVIGSFKISQSQYTKPGDERNTVYSGTKYQWGRKDPFVGICGGEYNLKTTTSNSYPVANATTVPYSNESNFPAELRSDSSDSEIDNNINATYIARWRKRIAWGIGNPYVFLKTGWGYHHRFNNLWNVNYDGGSSSVVTKSIFDPSPRGFRVPHLSAFLGLSEYGIVPADHDGNCYQSGSKSAGTFYGELRAPDYANEINRGTYFATEYRNMATCAFFLPSEREYYHTSGTITGGVRTGYWTANPADDLFTSGYNTAVTRGQNTSVHGACFQFNNNVDYPDYAWIYPEVMTNRCAGFSIRPVVDDNSVTTGATTSGQTVVNQNFSGSDWD